MCSIANRAQGSGASAPGKSKSLIKSIRTSASRFFSDIPEFFFSFVIKRALKKPKTASSHKVKERPALRRAELVHLCVRYKGETGASEQNEARACHSVLEKSIESDKTAVPIYRLKPNLS